MFDTAIKKLKWFWKYSGISLNFTMILTKMTKKITVYLLEPVVSSRDDSWKIRVSQLPH